MSFKDAYMFMLQGKRITRPCFKGHWYIDGVSGKLTIHMGNGEEITQGDLGHTLINSMAEDWMVIDV